MPCRQNVFARARSAAGVSLVDIRVHVARTVRRHHSPRTRPQDRVHAQLGAKVYHGVQRDPVDRARFDALALEATAHDRPAITRWSTQALGNVEVMVTLNGALPVGPERPQKRGWCRGQAKRMKSASAREPNHRPQSGPR